MTPVLPAFAGYVPKAFKAHYPAAKYHPVHWVGGFNTLLLDPLDPNFVSIGKQFMAEYTKEFGASNHVYSSDTFNEVALDDGSTGFIMAGFF